MVVRENIHDLEREIVRPQRGIQSVEIGGLLIQALTDMEGAASLGDLARRAGMPAAKAHPYLVSFGKIGLIMQDRATGRYDFGPLALQMGLASLRRLSPLQIALTGLKDLVTATGHTAALAVWGNHGPTVVHIEESPRPLHVNLRIGSVMSLMNTATGNIFLAHLPPPQVEQVLTTEARGLLPTIGTDRTPVMAAEEIISMVRSRGMARAIGFPLPGINALSAPAFDHRGELCLCITLIGPSAVFEPDWKGTLARQLSAFTDDITRRLGGQTKLSSGQD